MTDWRAGLNEDERAKLCDTGFPEWMDAMKATLTDDHFSSPDWIFEPKLDGERLLAFRRGNKTHLYSRNRKELTDTYPELAEALAAQADRDMVVDGEVVAFDGNRSSFPKLQGRLGINDPDEARVSDIPVFLYLFDVLYLDGYDVRELPLRTRKQLLKQALQFDDPLRYTSHRNSDGVQFYEEACRKGWEGVIAKRADSVYRESRSKDWLKFKCVNQQELVIGGYTDPQGERTGFGALLLGYYDNGEFCYAGRVGTGFDEDMLEDLHARLSKLARSQSPFDTATPEKGKGTHWVKPQLVCEVAFTEWTRDGRLRHPRFLGLRDDKSAGDVRRERPA
ncbi:non-homologous end-joining DNA ligase [Marinobacter zhanjiangensis]|uniref:DNA ligase (ATP) n=1 Tax=Marinobacter zhanjiangensis TaxID=578215 RepID=A0ABQ3AT51_9GAMM|nr:non-homologous end-joining DNA ligase [Marinobacter zhanjiangensis]GGY64528.1 ATP-dependent DNA ligase [Marinobacter zhanjiangensis]